MTKDEETLLQHILEAIDKIEGYTQNTSKEEFLEDSKTQDAVVRRLEIVGEAIKNLPEEFREENKDELWDGAAGMRDILIHQYFGVDLKIVWNTVNEILPQLKKNVQEMSENN